MKRIHKLKAESVVLSCLILGQLGCGNNKDLTANALSQRLSITTPSICETAGVNGVLRSANERSFQSPWEVHGKKLLIEENRLENNKYSNLAVRSIDPILPAGTKLDVEVNVSCIVSADELGPVSAQVPIPTIKPSTNLSHFDNWVASIELSSEIPTSVLSDWMEADPCVNGADRSGSLQLAAAPDDTMYTSQTYMNTSNLKATAAWDKFYHATTGMRSEVVIAIIDSGVEISHEDLSSRLWVNSDEVAGNGVDDDGNGYVDDVNGYNFASNIADPSPQTWQGQGGAEAHGTHVAGVAAAQEGNGRGIAGVNGRFGRIMGLNVFGAVPRGDNNVIARAIDYAWRNGANVINMSLGGQSPSSAILAAMNRAISNGVFVVVAAGNSNCDMTNPGSATCSEGGTNYFSPGASNAEITGGTAEGNGFLSVGAINQSGGSRCSFSNYGASVVEIGAPGCTGILSTVRNNQYSSSNWSGTSMASPLVAGGVSLAYGLIKDRTGSAPTPALLEEVVIAGSRNVASLNTFFEEGQVLDLVALVEEIDRRFPADSGGGGPIDPPPCP